MKNPTLSVFPGTKNAAFAHSEFTHANIRLLTIRCGLKMNCHRVFELMDIKTLIACVIYNLRILLGICVFRVGSNATLSLQWKVLIQRTVFAHFPVV